MQKLILVSDLYSVHRMYKKAILNRMYFTLKVSFTQNKISS